MAATPGEEPTTDSKSPARRLTGFAPTPVHPALQDLDPSTKFFYTPHTITGLAIGA